MRCSKYGLRPADPCARDLEMRARLWCGAVLRFASVFIAARVAAAAVLFRPSPPTAAGS